MRSLKVEELEVLRFVRANGCVEFQDVCRVSYVDATAIGRILGDLAALGLVRETADGIKPVDQVAVEE